MLFLAVFVVINLNDSTCAYTHQKYPLPNNATKVGISRGETPLYTYINDEDDDRREHNLHTHIHKPTKPRGAMLTDITMHDIQK